MIRISRGEKEREGKQNAASEKGVGFGSIVCSMDMTVQYSTIEHSDTADVSDVVKKGRRRDNERETRNGVSRKRRTVVNF